MKEFPFGIKKESLHLRLDARNPLDMVQLTVSKNLKPKKELGLVPYEPVTNIIFDPEINVKYPTQLFRGREVTLLVAVNELYLVNEDDWSITQLSIYDPYNESSQKSITAFHMSCWHFADLGPAYMLFNGSCIVYKMNRREAFGNTEKVFVNDIQTIQTGCIHKGRLITGGFSNDFWRGDWKDFFFSYLESSGTGLKKDMNFGRNWVMWSTIGGGELLSWLHQDYGIRGITEKGHSESKPFIMDMIRRNEMGFMPMPWQGDIYRVAPLGNNVIVYGDKGVAALLQVTEPLSTFGLRTISSIGCKSRSCVGVANNRHVFIDDMNRLCIITPDLKMTVLGYEEFLNISSHIHISYNEILDEFIISYGHYLSKGGSYILTDGGLGYAEQEVFSVLESKGVIKGVTRDASGTLTAVLTTSPFDMGIRGIKQINDVAISGTSLDNSNMTVEISCRYNKSGDFISGGTKPVNKEGYAYPLASGNEFILTITCTDYQYTNIDDITIRYKLTDKRGIRGIYGN